MYYNYIFDLYGTLVDISTDEKKPCIWEKMALWYQLHGADYSSKELNKQYHILVKEALKNQKQENPEIKLEKVFKQMFQNKNVEVTSEFASMTGQMFRTLSIEHLTLYHGVKELLQRLKSAGKKIYLLSNAQRFFTEPEMRMLGIYDFFDGVLFSSDIGIVKPGIKFYQALFEQFQLEKQTSVMVGNDIYADIYGAKEFGIQSMYIHTAQSPEVLEPLPEQCRKLKEIGEVFL